MISFDDYFTRNYSKTGLICDFLLDDVWMPAIMENCKNGKRYKVYTKKESYYYNSDAKVPPNIKPAGTHALETWVNDFEWLCKPCLILLYEARESYVLSDLIMKINPIRLMVGLSIADYFVGEDVRCHAYTPIYHLFRIWIELFIDYDTITVNDYLDLFPQDKRFILELDFKRETKEKIMGQTILLDFRSRNNEKAEYYPSFGLSLKMIDFILQHTKPHKRGHKLNSYLLRFISDENMAKQLIARGADIDVIITGAQWPVIKYPSITGGEIEIIGFKSNKKIKFNNLTDAFMEYQWIYPYFEYLRDVKLFCEYELADIVFPRVLFNIITSYFSWYHLVELSEMQKYFISKSRKRNL